MNLVSAFNIKMARTTLSSIFVPFLILLVIAITFFAELTPVSAGLSTSLKLINICKDVQKHVCIELYNHNHYSRFRHLIYIMLGR